MATSDLSIILSLQDKASKELQEFSGKLQGMESQFKQMAKVGAIGFGVISGAIIKSGIDIDKASSNIVKGTGASGDALKEMVNISKQVSKNVPQNLDTISGVLAEVNTRLDLTGDSLQDATTMMLDFARVTGGEPVESTRIVSRLINALGIEANQASSLLDKLTFASQKSGINAQNLARYITEAGPAFEQMGFGLDRSIALFSEFEKAGARPEEVIGSLNIALNRMAKEGFTNAEEAFSELMQGIKDAPDILSATLLASELFGSRVGGKIAEDIREGRFEVDNFVASLQDVAGTLEETAFNSMTFTEQLAIIKNNILAIIAPSEELRQKIGEVMAKILEWIRENDDLIRWLTYTALVIFGVVGAVGALGLAVLSLTKFWIAWKASWLLGGKALLIVMAKFLLIVAVIGLVIYTIYQLYKNWDYVIAIMQSALAHAGNTIKGIFEGIFNFIIDGMNMVISAINTAIRAMARIPTLGRKFRGLEIQRIERLDFGRTDTDQFFLNAHEKSTGTTVVNNFTGNTFMGEEEVAEQIGDLLLDKLSMSMKLN